MIARRAKSLRACSGSEPTRWPCDRRNLMLGTFSKLANTNWLDAGVTVLVFLVVLTILVFVHELGHYLLARRNGVKVEVFSIGFGPELFGFTDRAGTRWKFSAIPFGGYVKMFGD